MTRDQFFNLARLHAALWPDFTQTANDEWLAVAWEEWRDLDALQVRAALRALARDGRERGPNPGIVRAKIVELQTDAPDWGDVLRQLRGPMRYATGTYWDMLAPRRKAELLLCDEVVQRFAGHLGWDQLRASLDAGAFHGDTTGEAQLRGKWEAFIRRQQREETYRGIEAGGLPVLERANGDRPPRRVAQLLPRGEDR